MEVTKAHEDRYRVIDKSFREWQRRECRQLLYVGEFRKWFRCYGRRECFEHADALGRQLHRASECERHYYRCRCLGEWPDRSIYRGIRVSDKPWRRSALETQGFG